MRKTLSTTVVLIMITGLVTVAAANTKAKHVREERKLEEFASVSVATGIKLTVTPDVDAVTVISTPDMIQYILTTVGDGALTVRVDRMKSIPKRIMGDLIVLIPANEYREIRAASGSTVILPDTYSSPVLAIKAISGSTVKGGAVCDTLSLSAIGGSSIKMMCKAGSITISAESGSTVKLTGEAGNAVITAKNGSSVSCLQMPVKTASCTASGAGSITVNVSEDLKATATGAGAVRYSGPATLSGINTSGAGSVKRH